MSKYGKMKCRQIYYNLTGEHPIDPENDVIIYNQLYIQWLEKLVEGYPNETIRSLYSCNS